MKKKWDRAAMRFTSAKHVSRQGILDVTFENGDRFLVATESILPLAINAPVRRNGPRAPKRARTAPAPDWVNMRIGETGDVLEVPALDAILEIPWDRIRAVADPEFRAHLADHAAARARQLGGRIRSMRLQAGLTRAALAEKIGVPRAEISNLETGSRQPTTDLIEHIAVALGRRLRDFADE